MTMKLIDKAKRLYESANDDQKHVLESLFPELKESEDERIRKALIKGFNECLDSSSYPKNAQKYWHNIKIEDIFTWLEKQGEQKSAWSEEDALRLEEAIYMIKARGWIRSDDAVKLVLDWLKCLKDRVQPQPKQEWSEEDRRIWKDIIRVFKGEISFTSEKSNEVYIAWLKSLKDRVGCEANCTTTKEWNESDKEEFQIAIDTLVEAGQHDSAHWLKSLKQRIGG